MLVGSHLIASWNVSGAFAERFDELERRQDVAECPSTTRATHRTIVAMGQSTTSRSMLDETIRLRSEWPPSAPPPPHSASSKPTYLVATTSTPH